MNIESRKKVKKMPFKGGCEEVMEPGELKVEG